MTRPCAAPRVALIVAASLCGCLPILHVSTRTRILPDGTAVRETVIRKERRDPHDERERSFNERPVVEDLARALGDGFASVERTDDVIRLSGVFADPARIPSDFQRDVPAAGAMSQNRVDWVVEDLLFGKRCIYRERYVDAIAPEDLKDAKREAVEFATRFVRSAARHEFGDGYETARFDAWTRTDLAEALSDLVEIYWSERRSLGRRDPVSGATGLDRALVRAAKRLAKLGLQVDPDATEEMNVAAVRAFVTGLLAKTLEPKSGARAARPARPDDFQHLFSPDDPFAGLRIAATRAAERDFGSTAAAEEALERVLLGVTGTFASPPAEAEFRFDCAVEMPGLLLHSNGYLESERAVFWLFDGDSIFPDGQRLEAESFVPDPSLLGRFRELKSDVDRRDAVRLAAALAEVDAAARAQMRHVLEAHATYGTLEPLLSTGDADTRALLEKLAPVLDVMKRR